MTSLTSLVRSTLLSKPDVSRVNGLHRSASLYSQGQPADSLYFIEEGLIKLTRTSASQGRIILSVCGPNHVIGEEALAAGSPIYYTEAEVLTDAIIYRIPRESLLQSLAAHSELATALIEELQERKLGLAQKVELLCLHDVEYRILHYLAELSKLVKPSDGDGGYQLPITQLELADLIGATRETTSTTLNQLERRGLVKLSRRLLTIPSPVTLRSAANEKMAPASAVSQAQ